MSKISFLDAFPPNWLQKYNKKNDIFEDILYEIIAKYDNIKNFFRNIKFFFINIIKFRSILWNDRDWDYMYILDIMKLKLECTKKLIVNNNFIVDAKEIGEQIDKSLYYLNNFVYYDDIFEERNQDILYKAMNETNKEKKEELQSYYLKEQYKFQEESWINLWYSIFKNMRKWWE